MQSCALVDFCYSNEPYEVAVTTGGEKTAHGLLNWKSPASDFTSSVPFDLGSKTDEFSASYRAMVLKMLVERSSTASNEWGELKDIATKNHGKKYNILHDVTSESFNKDYLTEEQLIREYGAGTLYSGALLGYGFMSYSDLFYPLHDTPSELQFITHVCSVTFPPRLFDQPVLMPLRITDPG